MKGWLGAVVLASTLALPANAQDVDWKKAIDDVSRQVAQESVKKQYLLDDLQASVVPHYARTAENLSMPELLVYQSLATAADVESTLYAIHHCRGCQEGNPIMKPFVRRGRGAMYGIQALFNYGIWKLALDDKHAGGNRWDRAIKWNAMAHYLAACSNMQLVPDPLEKKFNP